MTPSKSQYFLSTPWIDYLSNLLSLKTRQDSYQWIILLQYSVQLQQASFLKFGIFFCIQNITQIFPKCNHLFLSQVPTHVKHSLRSTHYCQIHVNQKAKVMKITFEN